ncbi:MAG: hypothetical protein JSW47_07770 [Phycisphaerales bacterium]|nr:MAG: hypothetical protein JSW47_07770 [Phycisphaerales bacterium]
MLEEIASICVYMIGASRLLCDAGNDMSDVGQKSVWIIVLNLPLYFIWGWVLFRTWGSFWEAICFLFKPELWSFIDGQYWDDIIAEGKLAIWIIVPILLIRLELWLFLGI